ncbi:MAG: helix-hairpin-helix domain-containing protein [Candidatus Bathyarchaeia archaeon]
MRLDYALYAVAIILFIVTGVALAYPSVEPKELWVVSTAVLGLVFVGLGYLQRPKPQARTVTFEAPQPAAAPAAMMPPPAEQVTPQPVEQATLPAEQVSQPPPQEAPLEAAATEMSVLSLTDIKGIGQKRAEQLRGIGITSVESLAVASVEDIASKLKVSPKIVGAWIEEAKRLIGKS